MCRAIAPIAPMAGVSACSISLQLFPGTQLQRTFIPQISVGAVYALKHVI